jgi:diamine N-acetyltransferase
MLSKISQIVIRRATVDDVSNLSTLGAATFTQTFGHLYPREDLQAFLVASHSVDAWTHKLVDTQYAVWLAMLMDSTPIGFIVAGTCKLPIENRESTSGEIQQLYVLARYHNLRLGSRLMDHALEWLTFQRRAPLYVGVWSENFGAQRFYSRYGFKKVGEYGFRVGTTIDREFILKR